MGTFEKEINVMVESANIEIMRAEADFNKVYPLYMLESKKDPIPQNTEPSDTSGKQRSSFKEVITKIFNAIMNVLRNFANAVGSLFKSEVSAEEYFDDPNVKIMMDENVEQIVEMVDAERRQGRKFLQMLSRGTKIPDKELEVYLDRGWSNHC